MIFWRFRRKLRDTIVIVGVAAFAIAVFLGLVHAMAPDAAAPEESSSQAAPVPAVTPQDGLDE